MPGLEEIAGNENEGSKRIVRLLRHGLSICVWTYFLLSVSPFDLNSYLISTFPPSAKYIHYKWVFIILLLALLWSILGTKVFIPAVAFVVAYPVIIIATITFRVMGFSPNAFLAVIGSLILAIRSAKRWIIRSALYFSLFTILYVDFGKIPTALSMVGIFLLLLVHYVERFYSAFQPETLISRINRFIRTKWSESREGIFVKDILDSEKYPPGSAARSAKKFEKIVIILLFNVAFRFVADKLRQFQETRVLAVYSIYQIVVSLALTVVVYGFEYLALNRVAPGSFAVPENSSIFFYMYASFNTILTMGMPDFTPIRPLGRLMMSSELIFGLFLLIILFFVFTTILRERHQTELDELIALVDGENAAISYILVSHFDTTLERIQRLEGIEEEQNRSQIEAILKFQREILKISD